MTDDTTIPADARNRLEADIAGLQAAVIDADIVDVGRDAEYRPDCPRLRAQIEANTDG
jgi:hypothetical protein